MPDPRFFSRAGPFTLGALAELSEARLLRPDEGGRLFYDVSPLETAGPEELSFLENRKYVESFVRSAAGAVIADQWAAERAPPAMALIVSDAPYKAYALVAQAFYPEGAAIPSRASSALIDPAARVPDDCAIGPNAVIERDVELGRRCQIGANVVLGRCCILAGQVGISGSTTLDDFVMVGGQGGLAGHLHIGSGARIAAKSGLMRDVAAGQTVCGSPAVPLPEFMRQTAVLQRLAKKKDR